MIYKRWNGKRITSKHPKWDDGTWYCRVRVKGKAYHRSLHARTKEQAEKEVTQLIDEILHGCNIVPGFSSFVDDVYKRYIDGLKSKETQEFFITELKKHFKNRPLNEVSPQDCRDYQRKRLRTPTKKDTPRSPASVNREIAALSKIFSLAEEMDYVLKNPVKQVKKLREAEPRRRVLSPDQWTRLWAVLENDPYLKAFVVLALNLPLRKTQILAIRGKDIDFEHKVLWTIGSKRKPPRILPMIDIVESTLRDMFTPGDIFPVKRFEKRWRRALVEAGINDKNGSREANLHIHDLRAHLGTRMIHNKVNPMQVQRVFNHTNMTTSAIYVSVDIEAQRAALQAGATYPVTNPVTNSFGESHETQ